MKVKTSELTGAALDWAGATCEGYACQFDDEVSGPWLVPQEGYLHDEKPLSTFSPSTNWAQGGPISEREGINVFKYNKLDSAEPDKWCAHKVVPRTNMEGFTYSAALALDGPTELVSKMRCFVAAKLGDEVDVPEELL